LVRAVARHFRYGLKKRPLGERYIRRLISKLNRKAFEEMRHIYIS